MFTILVLKAVWIAGLQPAGTQATLLKRSLTVVCLVITEVADPNYNTRSVTEHTYTNWKTGGWMRGAHIYSIDS